VTAARRILFVDDDKTVLSYMQAKLGARYELLPTSAPRDVVRLARDERPDLIICDVEMPGMDGGDVSAAVFADDAIRHIPMLFLTSLVSPEDLARLQGQLGGRPAVSKRAPLGELVSRIEALLPA
jgi:CheY-like chemotaxis protein